MTTALQSFSDNNSLNSTYSKKEKPKSVLVILRREFLTLLQHCVVSQKQTIYCAAKLIEYYRHWRKWKVAVHRTEWIYQPLKNIYDDLMQEHSRHVIRDAIALLMQLGYLERRKNPGNGQDRTYQYRLRIDRLTDALIDANNPNTTSDVNDIKDSSNPSLSENYAESSFVRSEHGEFNNESGNFIVEQYPQIRSTLDKPTKSDGKKSFEEKKDKNEDKESESTSTVETISFEENLPTSLINSNEDQSSADGALQNFTITSHTTEGVTNDTNEVNEASCVVDDVDGANEVNEVSCVVNDISNVNDIKEQTLKPKHKDGLQKLFVVETDYKASPERHREPRRIKIEGLDEGEHEVLWKHQEKLIELNADVDSDRIRDAIADNPQNLEDAILAFFEASAKGRLTEESATGYLYNALRNGWKPRYPNVPDNQKPKYFTAPPEFFEKRQPPTLAELVELKRQAWKVPILRPTIEAWVKATPGVILTDSGPALEAGYES